MLHVGLWSCCTLVCSHVARGFVVMLHVVCSHVPRGIVVMLPVGRGFVVMLHVGL